jgi:hypothetical protein
MMSSVIHQTTPLQVWADIDVGIADLVRALNVISGVRTYSSCQGTLGEGGHKPYAAYVTVSWSDADGLARIQELCVVEVHDLYSEGVQPDMPCVGWGTAHPKNEPCAPSPMTLGEEG